MEMANAVPSSSDFLVCELTPSTAYLVNRLQIFINKHSLPFSFIELLEIRLKSGQKHN